MPSSMTDDPAVEQAFAAALAGTPDLTLVLISESVGRLNPSGINGPSIAAAVGAAISYPFDTTRYSAGQLTRFQNLILMRLVNLQNFANSISCSFVLTQVYL